MHWRARESPGPNQGAATRYISQGLQRRRPIAAAALALVMASTPALTSATAAPPQPQPAAHQASVFAVPDADVAGDLKAARLWAASRPTRAKPAATPPAPPPPAPPPVKPAVKKKPRPKPVPKPVTPLVAPDGSRAGAVVAYALAQVGKPYRYATDGPDSFDCSGLAKASYASIGITIPHQTGGIVRLGRPVERDHLEAGDLVFPSSGHVGIYIGRGLMVHAPKPGDHVKVSGMYSFWTARRLL